jgi:hypothetical protein
VRHVEDANANILLLLLLLLLRLQQLLLPPPHASFFFFFFFCRNNDTPTGQSRAAGRVSACTAHKTSWLQDAIIALHVPASSLHADPCRAVLCCAVLCCTRLHRPCC